VQGILNGSGCNDCQQFHCHPVCEERAFWRMFVRMHERKDVIEQVERESGGFGVLRAAAPCCEAVEAKGLPYGFVFFAVAVDLDQDTLAASGANHRTAAITMEAGNEVVATAFDATWPFIHGLLLPGIPS
jgi:hypothetical protein